VSLPSYVAARHTDDPGPDRRGRTESFTFHSDRLDNDRNVTVYVPPAYDDGAGRPYPLLVVQEGPAWLEKGLLTNTLDNLVGRRIAPVVVAFVDPVDAWWLEAGGSQTATFVDVLAEELVPELARRYRVSDRSADRAIHGSRDYGLTAVYAGIGRPDVFGKVAVQSVGLRNGAQAELLEMIRSRPQQAVELYVDWNLYEARSVDQDFDFGADSRTLLEALVEAGYSCSGGRARDSHGWSGWRSRTDRFLEQFFPRRGGDPPPAAGGR
jgi:enterochelin esterase family protein